MSNNISVADGERLMMAFGASAGSPVVAGTAVVPGVDAAAGAAVVAGVAELEPQAASPRSSADAAAVRNNFKGTSSE
jgi:hypothetical protein